MHSRSIASVLVSLVLIASYASPCFALEQDQYDIASLPTVSLDKVEVGDTLEDLASGPALHILQEAVATSPDLGTLDGKVVEIPKVAPEDAGKSYAADEVLVVFEKETSRLEANSFLEESGLEPQDDNITASIEDESPVLVQLDEGQDLAQALQELAADPAVAYVQPNYLYSLIDDELTAEDAAQETSDALQEASSATDYVNDPYAATKQWHLDSIGIGDAWGIMKAQDAAPLVSVAVFDTGVDISHPDLVGNLNLAQCYDVYEDKSLSGDTSKNGHGTHVAGIISAVSNNEIGVSGVTYNAQLICYNVFFESKDKLTSNTETLCDAYTRLMGIAQECNVRVINMSLGGQAFLPQDSLLARKIDEAAEAGIVSVCAAGNYGNDLPVMPGDYETCVSVIALTDKNTRWSFSCFGDEKDISAPGSEIYSTVPSSYWDSNGTSMAAPIVSGVFALLFSFEPSLTPAGAKQILYSSATDLGVSGRDNDYGWGKVNAAAAMQQLAVYKELSSISIELMGNDRYDTMKAIIRRGFASDASEVAVLVTGEDYPDALVASAFAGVFNAPVVLTATDSLSTQARDELIRIGAKTVYIIGGTGAVSSLVESQVEALSDGKVSTKRVYGQDRIATALEVYAQKDESGASLWTSRVAILATSADFADALSASPYAYRTGSPIFLAQADGTLSSATASAIKNGSFDTVLLLGGTSVVSDVVKSQIGNAKSYIRLAGVDRYETGEKFASWATSKGGMTYQSVGLATGLDFPDALAGSALCGRENGVLLLADDSNEGKRAINSILVSNVADISRVYLFGGKMKYIFASY